MSAVSPMTRSMSAIAASSSTSTVAANRRTTRSTKPAAPHTGAGLLTDRQQARLEALFPLSEHIEIEATRGIYQRMITAHHEPDRQLGNKTMHAVINTPTTSVPATLIQPQHLSRTLKKHAANILTFFDHPDTPNTPTEAINRPLKHPHESTPSSRNPTNHNTRPLLKPSSFKPHPHPQIRRACLRPAGVPAIE